MANFCPDCGSSITNIEARFCENCGYSINHDNVGRDSIQTDLNNSNDCSRPTTKDLGSHFEKIVEEIFQSYGYSTARNVKLPDIDGLLWEIDILATRNNGSVQTRTAVECKNYSGAVGREKVDKFCSTLSRLGIRNGVFVAYSRLTSDAKFLAESKGVQIWEYDDVTQRYMAIKVGRGSVPKVFRFEQAIPSLVEVRDAVRLNLYNAQKVTIESLRLIWKPYFRIGYDVSANVRIPGGKDHKINDSGFCIINGLDTGETFLQAGNGEVKSTGVASKLSGIKAFVAGEIDEDRAISFELMRGIVKGYSNSGNGDVQTVKVEPTIGNREAKKIAFNAIIKHNTTDIHYTAKNDFEMLTKRYVPKPSEIIFKENGIVFVPMWEVTFNSSGRIYSRKLLGNSGTILEDTISYCPNHMLKDIVKTSKKEVVAVCEICGDALCANHISRCPVCGKWLCETHSISCSSCGQKYCREHIITSCQVCNLPICDSCLIRCSICGKALCRAHQLHCGTCNQMICSDCVVESRGLLRKNHVCNKCVGRNE